MSDTVIKPMSEPARRLEIFTGAGRRRKWSAEQKAEIVAESVGGGESVSAVARRHGLTPPQLFAWPLATNFSAFNCLLLLVCPSARRNASKASKLLSKRVEVELHVHKLIEDEPRTFTVWAPDNTNTLAVSGLATDTAPSDAARRRLVISEWKANVLVMLPPSLAASWLAAPPPTFEKDARSDALQFWLVIGTDQWGNKTRIQFVGGKSASWERL